MEKANKVLWLVKVKDELDLAAAAIEPESASYHRQRATEFQRFASQDDPPDVPLDPNFS